jgi:integrase
MLRFFVQLERRREEETISPVEREDVLDTLKTDAAAISGSEVYEGQYRAVALQRFLDREGLECPPTSPTFQKLSRLFQAAELEHTMRGIDSLEGRPVVSHDPRFREYFAHSLTPHVESSPTLGELLTRYRKHQEAAKRSKSSLMAYELPARILREEFGEREPLSAITRARVESLIEILRDVPQNASQRYPGLTLREAVAAAEKAADVRRLKRVTLIGYHANIGAIFKFGVAHGMMKENPAANPYLRETFGEESVVEPRAQFTVSQLNRLFRAPLYTGCIDDENGYARVGPSKPRRGRFWIPLLALFHGMRCNEACQLYTQDVKERDGIPFFAIREELENGEKCDKNLKTRQSRREVPIHPELERVGFLDFVNERRGDHASRRLFPDLAVGGKGYFSNPFSKWFGRFVEKALGLGVQATFHSFRHQFRDACRVARLDAEIVALLAGWEPGGAGGKVMNHYGRGPEFFPLLAEAIAKVRYAGLDLSHLYRPKGGLVKSVPKRSKKPVRQR